MEEEKSPTKLPKPIISRAKVDRANTYGPQRMNTIGSKKKKKVMFTDRAQSLPLCTVFNYEQVDIANEPDSPKTSSCACFIF